MGAASPLPKGQRNRDLHALPCQLNRSSVVGLAIGRGRPDKRSGAAPYAEVAYPCPEARQAGERRKGLQM